MTSIKTMSIDHCFRESLSGSGLPASTLRKLLDASYGGDPPRGWRKDKELSTNQNKVFVGPSGQAVVSHRGTSGTAQDWANNAIYGLAGETAYKMTGRYRKAARVQAAAESKYGKVITIGHSQGGLLAQQLGKDEVITLNKATKPSYLLRSKRKKQTDVRSTGDVVSSMGNPSQKTVRIRARTSDPLTEHGTDVLDALGELTVGL